MKTARHNASLACMIVGAIGLSGMGFAVGMAMPVSKAATFEIVRYVGDESDIVDHGLTGFECAASAAFAASLEPGARFECEREINL